MVSKSLSRIGTPLILSLTLVWKTTINIDTAEKHSTSKQQHWRIPLKNPSIQDISVNTSKTCKGFDAADTTEN